ncbi:hypothetical protein EKK58_09390 [Candidatus Dependentiae bacterium]|nr:MAG: hypothetical protein EKK58_09390 [Candidatus Dependentiae bacterium]
MGYAWARLAERYFVYERAGRATMTPTEQDKELQKEVYKHLEFLNSPKSDLGTEIDHIMQLIIADRKRVALEARLDELENRLRVQFIPSHWARLCAEVNSWAKYVDRRIAELKSQQEEV